MAKRRKRVEAVKALAAEFSGGILSLWAVHTRGEAVDILGDGGDPHGARIVPVRIIRESDYRRLTAKGKRR